MDELYIEIEWFGAGDELFTTIESFLSLYVYRYIGNPQNLTLRFVESKFPANRGKLKLQDSELKKQIADNGLKPDIVLPDAIHDLKLPVYAKNGNIFIAGMCAVCREIIILCPDYHELLGFKQSCLLAPSEASIWTRFCEVDIPQAIQELLVLEDVDVLPSEMPLVAVRFENHMKEPVRMHNIYKVARQIANSKLMKKRDKVIIDCSTPKEQLLLEHKFAEGVSFTIADLILYPCLSLLYAKLPGTLSLFPLTANWLSEVRNFAEICDEILMVMGGDIWSSNKGHGTSSNLKIPKCSATSLYKSDPKRYKPRNRIYTDQGEVDACIGKAVSLGLDFSSDEVIEYSQENIDWDLIEPEHEKNSKLPPERIVRKRQQLENLANAVRSLVNDGERIIDFCSGTGHLGILLALVLPKCTIILMENKSLSLKWAKRRAEELHLSNVRFYQCNIDYYLGKFDIGTSLHACGSATDIVLQQCLRSRAKFVCCPCCYGSLQPMPHIAYPLSKKFRNVLTERQFLHIAHTADQAHQLGTLNCRPETTRQGQLCMNIVDTDRKLQAEEFGYSVILTRLKPEQCSPKNHLLIGSFDLAN